MRYLQALGCTSYSLGIITKEAPNKTRSKWEKVEYFKKAFSREKKPLWIVY